MALKDLASDLANFKYGISSPDKVDNQIEKGVDFFDDKTAGAKGFTPNTDLLTKYNQFMKDVRQNNTLPNQYDGESNILAPNSGLRTNTKTSSAYGTFGEYSEAEVVGLSNTSHVLSSDNLLGVRVQPQFTSDFLTTPLADYVSKLSPPEDIPQVFSLEPKYMELPDFTQWGEGFSPIGGSVSKFASLFQGSLSIYNPDSIVKGSNFSTSVTRGIPGEYTEPEGFTGEQYSLNLRKEAFRAGESPTIDTFQSIFSTDFGTLKSKYKSDEGIKDLFEFTEKGKDTFKNVPNGRNNLGKFTTKEFRKVANKGPFEGNDTHPLILRDVNSNWDNYINEKLIGGTAGDILSGALGFVGLLTRTSRDLADKARVFNFLISPKGRLFVAKQVGLQLLNPTLETKVYNPLSALGIAGANSLLEGDLGGLVEAAKSFLFPTHVQRHLNVSSILPIKSDRYEPIVLGTNDGKGRLSYQAQAFRSNLVPDIDLPEIPKANTGVKFLDNFVNKVVDKGNKKLNDIENKFNALEAAKSIAFSNPNRYLGLVSSAPVQIEDGIPSFTANPLTTPVSDVERVTDKKGKTFNKETNQTTDGDLIKRHSTLSYGQLKEDFSYGRTANNQGKLLSPNELNNQEFSIEGYQERLRGDKINQGVGEYDITLGPRSDGTLGEMKGDINTPNVDKINMIPYGSNESNTFQLPVPLDEANNDFIKFRFKDIVNNKWLIFRAILEGITDNVTPEYGEERYIGRPDKIYTYQGVDRNISFTFSIYPKTKQELPILMDKLNYLVGLCYPSYTEEQRMVTPFVEMTIGDMFVDTPGILNSLTVTVEEQSTWEIQDNLQFPHFLKASCDFKYIGRYPLVSTGRHYDLNRDLVKSVSILENRTGVDSVVNQAEEQAASTLNAVAGALGLG